MEWAREKKMKKSERERVEERESEREKPWVTTPIEQN